MEMAQLVELIEQERENQKMSREEFANAVGFRGATYHRQLKSERNMGIQTLKLYARYFRQQGNIPMLRALGAYALELTPDNIEITGV